MKVNEIFYSIQGEGPQVGMPAWFIRTTGCNLSCSWCDTKYALKNGKEMSFQEIKDQINNGCKNIVFTGGEPLLQEDLLALIKYLDDYNFFVETNGTIYKQELIGFAKFIVSPKLQFMNPKYLQTLQKWASHATFKFVVDSSLTCQMAVNLCKQVGKEYDIYFMPLGTEENQIKRTMLYLIDWCKEHAPNVRISPRLQISLYKNQRGV